MSAILSSLAAMFFAFYCILTDHCEELKVGRIASNILLGVCPYQNISKIQLEEEIVSQCIYLKRCGLRL